MRVVLWINFGIFLLSLLMKRFHLPFGSLLLVISISGLLQFFLVIAFVAIFSSKTSTAYRALVVVGSFFMCFTLVGILFRHQWWPMASFNVLYTYTLPIFLTGMTTQSYLYLNKWNVSVTNSKEMNSEKSLFLSSGAIVLIAIGTFFTSNEVFKTIFNPYNTNSNY